MKAITIKLFTFKELGKQAKAKALTDFRYLNVDFDWWEAEYEDFINLCETIGIAVSKDSIKFNGFYAQGDGSAFSATVNFAELTQGIRSNAWKKYAPLQKFRFPALCVDRRVMRLVTSGILPGEPQVIARHKFYDVIADLGIYVVNERRNHDNVFDELEKLVEWLRAIAQVLNSHLFGCLQKQYEFLIADSTVKESLLFNEYLFTADGRAAQHLYELAKHHNKTE